MVHIELLISGDLLEGYDRRLGDEGDVVEQVNYLLYLQGCCSLLVVCIISIMLMLIVVVSVRGMFADIN